MMKHYSPLHEVINFMGHLYNIKFVSELVSTYKFYIKKNIEITTFFNIFCGGARVPSHNPIPYSHCLLGSTSPRLNRGFAVY